MNPYYDDGQITIYHSDQTEIIHCLAFDVIVSDPPYGISTRTLNAKFGRGCIATSNNYPAVHGDDQPFDPSPLLEFHVPTVLFGANYFADTLPCSPSWLIWDKLAGLTSKRDVGFNDQADVELAWSNLGGPARLFSQRWMGAMKEGEDRSTRRRHPTEKPAELMRWVLRQCPGGTVIDPFMGSGTTLRAAKDLGRKAIGVEISEKYCEVAAQRLGQGVFDLGSVR